MLSCYAVPLTTSRVLFYINPDLLIVFSEVLLYLLKHYQQQTSRIPDREWKLQHHYNNLRTEDCIFRTSLLKLQYETWHSFCCLNYSKDTQTALLLALISCWVETMHYALLALHFLCVRKYIGFVSRLVTKLQVIIESIKLQLIHFT